MFRIAVIVRSAEDIFECLLFTKEFALMILTCLEDQCFSFHLDLSLPEFPCNQLPSHSHLFFGLDSMPPESADPQRRLRDVVFVHNVIKEPGTANNYEAEKSLTKPNNHLSDDCSRLTSTLSKLDSSTGCIGSKENASRLKSVRMEQWIVFRARRKCTLVVNGHLAACLSHTISRSKRFLRRLFRTLMRKNTFQQVDEYPEWISSHCHEIDFPWLIDIVSIWPIQRLDYAWGYLLNRLLVQQAHLEQLLAWMSTLGGAHSSLGERSPHHAEIAGRISLEQLKLAATMGNRVLVARCQIFWIYSVLQRHGYNRQVKILIRRIYKFATSHPVHDTQLITMCLSAWHRLRHLRRRNITHFDSSSKHVDC